MFSEIYNLGKLKNFIEISGSNVEKAKDYLILYKWDLLAALNGCFEDQILASILDENRNILANATPDTDAHVRPEEPSGPADIFKNAREHGAQEVNLGHGHRMLRLRKPITATFSDTGYKLGEASGSGAEVVPESSTGVPDQRQLLSATATTFVPATAEERRASYTAALNGLGFRVNEPSTKVQIRLTDGTRLVVRVNHTHTVGDVRNFINTARPQFSSSNYILALFPNTELIRPDETVEEANILNSVVVMKFRTGSKREGSDTSQDVEVKIRRIGTGQTITLILKRHEMGFLKQILANLKTFLGALWSKNPPHLNHIYFVVMPANIVIEFVRHGVRIAPASPAELNGHTIKSYQLELTVEELKTRAIDHATFNSLSYRPITHNCVSFGRSVLQKLDLPPEPTLEEISEFLHKTSWLETKLVDGMTRVGSSGSQPSSSERRILEQINLSPEQEGQCLQHMGEIKTAFNERKT